MTEKKASLELVLIVDLTAGGEVSDDGSLLQFNYPAPKWGYIGNDDLPFAASQRMPERTARRIIEVLQQADENGMAKP